MTNLHVSKSVKFNGKSYDVHVWLDTTDDYDKSPFRAVLGQVGYSSLTNSCMDNKDEANQLADNYARLLESRPESASADPVSATFLTYA